MSMFWLGRAGVREGMDTQAQQQLLQVQSVCWGAWLAAFIRSSQTLLLPWQSTCMRAFQLPESCAMTSTFKAAVLFTAGGQSWPHKEHDVGMRSIMCIA
jgi:hypothetical protein